MNLTNNYCTVETKHYILVLQKKDWASAAHYCQTQYQKGSLVVIRNAKEQQALAHYLSKHKGL